LVEKTLVDEWLSSLKKPSAAVAMPAGDCGSYAKGGGKAREGDRVDHEEDGLGDKEGGRSIIEKKLEGYRSKKTLGRISRGRNLEELVEQVIDFEAEDKFLVIQLRRRRKWSREKSEKGGLTFFIIISVENEGGGVVGLKVRKGALQQTHAVERERTVKTTPRGKRNEKFHLSQLEQRHDGRVYGLKEGNLYGRRPNRVCVGTL